MEQNENPLRKLGQAKATKRNLGVRHRKTVLSYNGSSINIHIDSTSAKESEEACMNEYCSDAQLESKQSQIYDIKAVTENKDKQQIKTIIGQLLGGSAENILSSMDKSDEESGKDDDSSNDSANN